jgi:hypothetical protein
METYQIVLLTLAAVLVVEFLVVLVLGGGSLARLGLAVQAFRAVLGDASLATKVQTLLHPPPPEPAKPKRLSGEPIRLLVLLQRESRLFDLFMEDMGQYGDEQILAAVKEIQPKAKRVLEHRLVLEPILSQGDGESAEVPAGFDPSVISVTGNVQGNPPFRGIVRHRGWRVKSYDIPPPPAGQDDLVIEPAEVEVV